MLRVDRTAVRERLDAAERARLRAQFDAQYWARLPEVIGPDLLSAIQQRVARAEFVRREHGNVSPPSIDLCMAPNAVSGMLELMFNDPGVFEDVEAMTGCSPISRFVGFVYRMTPDLGHHHNWHNDLIEDRMIAMSVNLGPGTYEGGILQLRERASGRVFAEVANTGPGDAALFALDPSLQHRVTGVTAGVKTAFVGWFCAGDSYPSLLRRASAS